MLCHLLTAIKTYTLLSSFYRMHGTIHVNRQESRPVALTMTYDHQQVTVVNDPFFANCFSNQSVALPLLTVPTMMMDPLDSNHYIIVNVHADIRASKAEIELAEAVQFRYYYYDLYHTFPQYDASLRHVPTVNAVAHARKLRSVLRPTPTVDPIRKAITRWLTSTKSSKSSIKQGVSRKSSQHVKPGRDLPQKNTLKKVERTFRVRSSEDRPKTVERTRRQKRRRSEDRPKTVEHTRRDTRETNRENIR